MSLTQVDAPRRMCFQHMYTLAREGLMGRPARDVLLLRPDLMQVICGTLT